MSATRLLESAWQDVRHAGRLFARSPGFFLVAALSVAVGVGANAAMFSIADGLILRPLPVRDPDGLLVVSASTPAGEIRNSGVSYPDFVDLRDRARTFADLAASHVVLAGVARDGRETPQGRAGLAVTANFFDVLGVRPAAGRTFAAAEGRADGRERVVVLSHELWSREFGGNAGVIGRTIRLSGQEVTVIGVTPDAFTGVSFYVHAEFYVPVSLLPSLQPSGQPNPLDTRDARAFRVIGRLAPGATVEQADRDARLIAGSLADAYPATNRGHGWIVRTEPQARFDEYYQALWFGLMLVTLAVAVLLVACANVAGLLTSRAPVRAREIAIRLAIGGSRVRIARQLITETFLIALTGGVFGLVLGYGGIRSFQQFQVASDFNVRFTFELDRRALLVGLAASLASALVAGVVPAWRSSREAALSSTLRADRLGGGRARDWPRYGLVASQLALTLVVLTVGVSFYRGFQAEYGGGPGFRTAGLLMMNVDTSLAQYDGNRSSAFFRLLEERASEVAGVESVGVTSFVPLSQDGGNLTEIVPEGFVLPAGVERVSVMSARVNERYFETIGVPIVSGRGFTRDDRPDGPPVVVVSRGMASRYWPGEDPLGKRIWLTAPGERAEIVGVAADAKVRLFTPASTPVLYLPFAQHPGPRATFVLATEGDAAALAGPLRAAMGAVDPRMPVLAMRTMEALFETNAKNLNTVLVRTIAGMGMMGLLLAAMGLYALMAHAVSRRTHEIAVRMAVGANSASVLRLMLRQAASPAVVGIGVGAALSAAAGAVVQGAFPNTGGDRLTYLTVVPAVVAVVLLAAYVPARRAARLDPITALRQQ